ncbi:SnoaL-like domain-containing protein [Sporobacter termitidis DSM 10068]|uniref:SnoaL-like domain-containing protein n=1 Tax=Sporobacter termitidis DSM 10068 TaxID=1123282 RepID=A0A1M5ZD37_9FIRM|nr:nuclear transport factor 2 family protein [Sporobacter termitidis]SHI22102.1 SnoaL-like domain-containing protein [Sporobacter termitidis DSM 10068]
MNQDLSDVTQIRDLIERWVVYRDALLWDKFRQIWHPEGRMKATWSDSSFEEFIKRTEEGVRHGLNILHILGGSAVEVSGARAVSMTKMIILQRAEVEGVLCDVSSYARHYDLWEKRDGRWGLVRRETIADKDRLDPVDGTQTIALDRELLNAFPPEYQHLAYLQTKIGYDVDKDVPRLSGGKALDALYRRGESWLKGT